MYAYLFCSLYKYSSYQVQILNSLLLRLNVQDRLQFRACAFKTEKIELKMIFFWVLLFSEI